MIRSLVAALMLGAAVLPAASAQAQPAATTYDTSDAALIRELPGFREGNVVINGVRLHYVTGGNGPALLLLPVAVVGGLLAPHELGLVSASQAPELEGLRLPLDLAAAGGGVLVLVAAALARRRSRLVAATDRPTRAALRALRGVQAAVAVVGLSLAVCTIGMSSVLDRRDLGMPGVWLLALLVEAGLVALLVAAEHEARQVRTEVSYDLRTGRVPQPR